MEPIRWGILSTGGIAAAFVRGLRQLPDAAVAAVGSRTAAAAEAFGAEHGIPRRHGSYEALAADPEVDVIYVATPHNLHAANVRLCLEAGKAVLCEKPFTVNAAEAAAVVALARERGLFLMEAMWTRFRPHMVELRRMLAAGAIGEPRLVRADYGFRSPFNPGHRLFARELAGGALLDVGVYPVSFVHMVLGAPEQVVSAAHLGETGVDEQMAAILSYPGGRQAVVTAATRTLSPRGAVVAGTEGYITIENPWYPPSAMTLHRPEQEPLRVELPPGDGGLSVQAAEVHRCLRAGLTESATMPLDESVAVMTTLDRIRAPWGLRYPGE
ncbi:MAG TPA: Gfo/Idh/MocA family oxidoreductase [Chloroflexaceae bacterium]|nr:Gfo/Idh/MocA family oxidoreductase [Chloroflexaceae bacterium]